ncbi:MAG: tetratricopeptide repeat protein [Polyangiaceae bacterium]
MFERLDRVDWLALSHAYGTAEEVPGMIRALVGDDREARRRALYAAHGNIVHQGTRYTATPVAIGFIVEALANPKVPNRTDLLGLLVACVAGDFGPTFGPNVGSGTIWGDATRPMAGYGETAELLGACERAAAPAVPVVLELLADGDVTCRAHAAWLLAALWAQTDRPVARARIAERRAVERDPTVRAMLAFALTHLCDPGDPTLASVFADDEAKVARLLAAMGSLRRGEATAEMAGALVEGLSDRELAAAYGKLPFDHQLDDDLGAVLARLDGAMLEGAFPVLVERLGRVKDFSAVGLLSAALAAAYGPAGGPVDEADGPKARALLEALAHNQAFWSIGNALSLLQLRGLPTTRQAMAERCGIEVARDPVEAARIGARAMEAFGVPRALAAWLEVVERFPDDREALVAAGARLVESGEHARARELLQHAVRKGPSAGALYGEALFQLGTACIEVGELVEAEHAFRDAVKHLEPEHREAAIQNRVTVLQRLGEPERALDVLGARDAKSATDHYNRGVAAVKAGRYTECIDAIQRSLALEPGNAYAHWTIACAHTFLGDKEAALTALRRTLELDPQLAEDIAADPDFEPLRAEPRFRALIPV